MVIVGIDPGLSGAFCFMKIDDASKQLCSIDFEKMPVIEREIDFQGLVKIFQYVFVNDAPAFFIEKVSAMPGQGVCSMFKFGRCVGAVQMLAALSDAPVIEVSPQKWQKEMHEGISRNSVKCPKNRSLIAAGRLFPKVNLLATERSRKAHEGFVDALLIAEYGRRQLFRIKEKGDF